MIYLRKRRGQACLWLPFQWPLTKAPPQGSVRPHRVVCQLRAFRNSRFRRFSTPPRQLRGSLESSKSYSTRRSQRQNGCPDWPSAPENGVTKRPRWRSTSRTTRPSAGPDHHSPVHRGPVRHQAAALQPKAPAPSQGRAYLLNARGTLASGSVAAVHYTPGSAGGMTTTMRLIIPRYNTRDK